MLIFISLMSIYAAEAQIKLPKIFTDNMVLQRDKPVRIWGWASKGAVVNLAFNGQEARAKADRVGRWEVTLKPMVFGGPFDLVIKDPAGVVTLKNVLIGDVWFCSGQSNMEMPIQGWNKDSVANAGKEIKAANYPQIRLFTVEKAMRFTPADDFTNGKWEVCSPSTVGAFSATAYFFGKKLNADLNIPIGLINSTWGGTNIQAWTSWDEMSKQEKYKNIKPEGFAAMQEKWSKNIASYNAALEKDPGIAGQWYAPGFNASDWRSVVMPVTYEQSDIGNADGIVWYRKEFELSQAQVGTPATLSLGAIDDWDETYVNGTLVGKTRMYSEPRKYSLSSSLLRPGKNVIVVKTRDTGGGGGFTGTAKELFLQTGNQRISLAGPWFYKPSVTTTQFDVPETGPNAFPSQLYNAMVAPVIHLAIKGAIWYQGEANTWEAYSYRTLFPTMINDWRAKFNDQFPFLWVQLANFMKPVQEPAESQWAELREAQHMTLSLPNTGEAVIMDIGDANDIHPRNKHDVGNRLALAALKLVYQKDVVHSGPVYKSMEVKGNRIELTFEQVGSGLVSKNDRYGYLRGFSIAGEDHKFVWAKAAIEGNKVIVFSDAIAKPVAVRYAWADNPDDANLFNKEGLPASPFRTDSWKGITER